MNPRDHVGLTRWEVLVAIGIVVIIATFIWPAIVGAFSHPPYTQTLSNMKQLYGATQQMALDGLATTNASLGWPGDTGGTFSNWTHQLVPDYLTTNDLCKLLWAQGFTILRDKIPTENNTGVLVYAVSTSSPENAVFLSSANFTNTPTGGVAPLRSAKPYGKKAFIVLRKSGEGAILQSKQAGETNVIGTFVPLCR